MHYSQGLGWRFCKFEDLEAALLTVTMTRASVNLSPFAQNCISYLDACALMPPFTHVSPQAIVEVSLPKELDLHNYKADVHRIFIAYNIWAWVSNYMQ